MGYAQNTTCRNKKSVHIIGAQEDGISGSCNITEKEVLRSENENKNLNVCFRMLRRNIW